jgi:dTDP-4-dehydrorhamnose 3,5-epimerase
VKEVAFMIFRETSLKGLYLIDLDMRLDERGFFARYFCETEFSSYGLNTIWPQINTSLSKNKGTLRGLHFQRAPHSEVKLIRCLSGAIWDVVVDLRSESETFGKWFGSTLSSSNRSMMYVPKGFAHGFVTLEPNSEVIYLVSNHYAPDFEETLLWNDIDVNIDWPVMPLVISKKDANGKILSCVSPVKP